MDYENYWNIVMGPQRSAARVVDEFELSGERRDVDEWLSFCESEAVAQIGDNVEFTLDDLSPYHERALDELMAAIDV